MQLTSNRSKKQHSLTWRQTSRVLIAALLLGSLFYMIEVALIYQNAKQQALATQRQILNLAEPPAANAAWFLDKSLADNTLNGLLAIDMVISGEIILNSQASFSRQSKPIASSLAPLVESFHTLFEEFNYAERQLTGPEIATEMYGTRKIGVIKIQFDTFLITQNFVELIQLNFWSSLLRSLLLGLVLGFVFHRFLTRPIMQIGDDLQRINPDDPGVHKIAHPKGHEYGQLYYLVNRFNDLLSRLAKSQKNLRTLATRDPLTGLPNRTLIYEEMGANIRRSRQSKNQFGVFFLDLDRFKHVNDSLGHSAGDHLLSLLSDAFQHNLPEHARVGRLGGDEFVVISESIHNQEEALLLAKNILNIVNQKFKLQQVTVEPSCSVGIAIYPQHGSDVESLVRHADIAMYHAKSQGINRYAVFNSQMIESSEAYFSIENDLRDALDKDEFSLYFQPKISAENESLAGCEGLIRWHRKNELIPPNRFIPVAEDSQMIIPIGFWVIEEACKTISDWQQRGISLPIAINVSPIQLGDPLFLFQLTEIFSRYPDASNYLEFEITESSLMANLDKKQQLLSNLQQLGIRISIDDFGTGYSSLSYLRRLDIDNLKIDRSFIMDIPKEVAIPASILALAKEMGLKTVAEGVESEKQLDWLRANGCDMIQGYFYSKPLPLDAFEARFFNLEKQTLK